MYKIIISFSLVFLLFSCKSFQSPPEHQVPPPPLRALEAFEFTYYEYSGSDTLNPFNKNIAGVRTYQINDTTTMLEITFNDVKQTKIIFRGDHFVGETYIQEFSKYQRAMTNGAQTIIASRTNFETMPAFFSHNEMTRYENGSLHIAVGQENKIKFVGLVTPFLEKYTKRDGADEKKKAHISFYLDEAGMIQLFEAIKHIQKNKTEDSA